MCRRLEGRNFEGLAERMVKARDEAKDALKRAAADDMKKFYDRKRKP